MLSLLWYFIVSFLWVKVIEKGAQENKRLVCQWQEPAVYSQGIAVSSQKKNIIIMKNIEV